MARNDEYEFDSSWDNKPRSVKLFLYFFNLGFGGFCLLLLLYIVFFDDPAGRTVTHRGEIGEDEVNAVAFLGIWVLVCFGSFIYERLSWESVSIDRTGLFHQKGFLRFSGKGRRLDFDEITEVSTMQLTKNDTLLVQAIKHNTYHISVSSHEFDREDVLYFYQVLQHYRPYYNYEFIEIEF